MYICMYISICIHVHRERETKQSKETDRERERERTSESERHGGLNPFAPESPSRIVRQFAIFKRLELQVTTCRSKRERERERGAPKSQREKP